MTKYEVLLCIYYYLDEEYFADKNKSEEYFLYISNVDPDIWADDGTADPAYYADYLEICKAFFPEEECSVEDGFEYAKRYLDEYNIYEHEKFSSNIDEAVEVFSKCTLSEWEQVYDWVKNERNKKK